MNYFSKMLLPIFAGFMGLFFGTAGHAAEFRDWRDGDLIFQNSGSGQSAAILTATGSAYTHVAMVKLTPKGPIVVEAVGLGVKETSLRAFLARGESGHYAVYRVKNLAHGEALKALNEARRYYGRPYDLFFRPDKQRIYCSELVWLAFLPSTYRVGKEVQFSALNIDNVAVRALFSARWRFHPDCKSAKDGETCWAIVMKQPIVTPASLIADNAVTEKVFSNFGEGGTPGNSVLSQAWRYIRGPGR